MKNMYVVVISGTEGHDCDMVVIGKENAQNAFKDACDETAIEGGEVILCEAIVGDNGVVGANYAVEIAHESFYVELNDDWIF